MFALLRSTDVFKQLEQQKSAFPPHTEIHHINEDKSVMMCLLFFPFQPTNLTIINTTDIIFVWYDLENHTSDIVSSVGGKFPCICKLDLIHTCGVMTDI